MCVYIYIDRERERERERGRERMEYDSAIRKNEIMPAASNEHGLTWSVLC